MMDAARKKGQRRAVYLANKRDDPQQSIQLHGYRCRMYRDDGLYQTTEDQQGLPSSGQILEALLTDPASSLSLDKEKSYKVSKPQKDTAIETTKKREQERQKLEKLAEMSRSSRYRHRSCSKSYSRSPPRRYRLSRSSSSSRSSRRYYSYSRSHSLPPSHSRSPSPRVRSGSRY